MLGRFLSGRSEWCLHEKLLTGRQVKALHVAGGFDREREKSAPWPATKST
jgi:hypothetical protein